MLSLKDAVKSGKLEAFVKQEESRGVAPVDKSLFDLTLSDLIKQPQSKDQTSRSPSRGDSREK